MDIKDESGLRDYIVEYIGKARDKARCITDIFEHLIAQGFPVKTHLEVQSLLIPIEGSTLEYITKDSSYHILP
jgi:hypothetical protein